MRIMKNTLSFLAYWKISLPALLFLLLMLWLQSCGSKPLKTEANAPSDGAIAVRTVAVSRQAVTEPVTASGLVGSETEARLSFKTGGIIQKIYVEEGAAVRQGQLLAVLNLTEINAQVGQANEGMAKAERDYNRAKALYADSVATLEQYQNATTAYNVAKQSLEIARFNQSYSEIRAISSGKIVKKLMNEGELAGPGTPVFFLNATGTPNWVVKVGVADKDWVRIRQGDQAQVTLDALPGQQFRGVVANRAQGADQTSGLYQIEVKLLGDVPELATGFFASVTIQPSENRTYVLVPVDALVEGNGNQAFVFLPEGNRAKQQRVKVAYLANGNAMVYEGLAGNESLITAGSAYLADNSLIRIAK
jgi:RND family efflux transporter MFP subunit